MTWQIDDGYWKQYASRGSVSSLTVRDLNGTASATSSAPRPRP